MPGADAQMTTPTKTKQPACLPSTVAAAAPAADGHENRSLRGRGGGFKQDGDAPATEGIGPVKSRKES